MPRRWLFNPFSPNPIFMRPFVLTRSPRRATRCRPPVAAALRLLALALLLLPSLRAAAQCSTPTGLVASNVRGTTATLTFTGPAAATAYAVSYTYLGGSTGGTVQPNPTQSPVGLTGLPPSSVVTASVVAVCGGGQFSAAATVTFTTGPLNDEPCGATVLPFGGSGVGSTTAGATHTPANGYVALGCTSSGSGPPLDVWFAYTTPASGPGNTGVTLTTDPGFVTRQVQLFSAAACTGPFTSLGCSPAASGGLSVGGLAPGTTYYVRVATLNPTDPQGVFTLTATAPSGCGGVNNAAVGAITATSATISFQAGVNNGSYTLFVRSQAGALLQTVPAAGSPVTITGLTGLTDYTVEIVSNCPGAGTSNPPVRLNFRTTNGNDEPATAQLLTLNATCQPTAGSNFLATTTVPSGYANPGCNGQAQPADVWFRFATPATGAGATGVTVTATGFAANQLRLFAAPNGAAGPFAELGCAANLAVNGPAPALEVTGLVPGTTYFLSVATSGSGGGGSGGFTVCLTPAPACPVPVRLAAAAITTTSAQLSWTLFGPTAGSYAVEYGPTGFAPGTGAAGATVVSNLNALSYAATGLTPNTRYDFYVTRNCGAAGPSARSLPGSFRTLNVAAPANDSPCTATVLPFSGGTCTSPTPGTTAGATSSNVRNPNGQNSCADQGTDVWYAFTTPAGGAGSTAVAFDLTGSATRGMALWAAPACTGPFGSIVAQVCANQGSAPGAVPALVATGLTPNTTYYLQVGAGSNDPAGNFTLCARTATGCNAVTSGYFTVGNPVLSPNNTLGLGFVPVAGATSYTVVVSGPNGFSQTYPVPATITSSDITLLTGLTPSTAYTVQIFTNCPTGQSSAFVLTGTTAVAPPANDECPGAFPIACGQRKRVILTGATSAGDPQNCGGSGESVFYKFVGTGDSIRLTTCYNSNTASTSGVALFQGNCANLTCVPVALRNVCPLPQFFGRMRDYYFLSARGVNYYLTMTANIGGNYNDSIAISIACIAPPCPPVGGLTVSSLTATTVSVGFVPAAGSTAPGYTVRATPTGGGPSITASGAASPLALTGLSPNTAYTLTAVANCTATTSSVASTGLGIRTPLPVRNAALSATLGLYPNPAHRAATLVVPAALLRQPALLTLTDGLGRAVQQRFVSPPAGSALETRTELDLRGLPTGLYVLRLLSNAGPLVRQLVIE